MSDHLEQEIKNALRGLCEGHTRLAEAEWFLKEIYTHFSPRTLAEKKPELILLGADFPWELAWAFGTAPFYILGGSLETGHWADSLLPRDADPVSRSACGYLLNPWFNLAENALIVTTLCSDNRRKLVGLLRDNGLAVEAADIPPRCDHEAAQDIWAEEMLHVAEKIEQHTGRPLRRGALSSAIRQRQHIRKGIRGFEQAVADNPGCLSEPLSRLILESIWYTEVPDVWLRRLQLLTKAVRERRKGLYKPWNARPGILLAGSPVLFPNEKLPLLFESAGLRLTASADPVSIQMNQPGSRPKRFEGVDGLLRALSAAAPAHDVSGSQTVNRGLQTAVQELLTLRQIDGIVYHVLKGQIEFDFELPAIEAVAGQYGIPVFRLETDYQPQDVEQLRIRVEAFAEMLRQTRVEGARPA